ncbi:MAG: HAD-IC family P-type ATPase, partial [Nanoarchaeota archaeon]|nr:HAD-IC family P-type ATPase [Nanoarchaeota archaeon]
MDDEHKVDLAKIYARTRSSELGLTSEEANKRLEKEGLNILTTKKSTPLIFQFLKEFVNFFAILLLVGSALSFLAEYLNPNQGNVYIAVALVSVVILNTLFTFIQKYQSEKIMDSFQKMIPAVVKVLRDGEWIELDAKQLAIGDVIMVQEGDKVPADCRLIEVNALKVDNASITGESEPQLRKLEHTHDNILESRNMLFSGTLVQTGNGKGVVYAKGMDTQIGKIVSLTKETKKVETPLHKETNHFIKIISTIAITLGVLFFLISILLGKPLIGSIIFAIGIIVANVPEGLLPTITLALTIASKRMAKKNALVKNLESIETLGSTTVICTDKTGTLTQNKMKLSSIFINNQIYDYGFEKNNHNEKILQFELLLKSMVLCNNASRKSETEFMGDPTETALLQFSSDYTDISKISHNFKRVHETPFDSKTKRMITTNLENDKQIAYMKGAPEVIMEKCSKVTINNKIQKLSEKEKEKIISQYQELASKGQRVLGFAYKETKTEKVDEVDFIFLGLIGLLDPPRPEIKNAIAKCHSAGVKVIMMTGDYSLTAKAIGEQVGLVRETANVYLGEDLDKTNEEELKEILRKDDLIFARTNPAHKLRIVKTLQSLGEVVTVTGDGVNDAPALKNADMGVAMGLQGTEVAREAADMVLLDDNFATIVSAIEEGRTIFDNIKKFVAYILTSNVPQILPFIFFVLLGFPLAITVILILLIDLGTDLIPALGLAVEKPEDNVMKRKPRSRSERLLSKRLLFMSYGIIGMVQAAAGFFSFFYILFNGGWTWGVELAFNDPLYLKAVTAFFASIIICQIADVLICRTRVQSLFVKGFFDNKLVYVGILSELILLSIIVYLPIANQYIGTAPLSLFELSLSIPFALAIFFGDELRKYYLRKGNNFVNN